MLESLVEPVHSCSNDVGGDVPDELDKKDVVDKSGTTIATRFTCNRRRKSACWRNSSQAFPNIFSKQCWWGYRWSLYRVCCCAMTSCFGRWWKTRLILQEGLLELLLELGWYLVKVGVLRTWSPPINFNCPSAVFDVKCPQFGRDQLLRVELYVVEVWRVYFCPPAQGLLPKEFLSKLLSPRTRRIRGVIRVTLCSRIGGISIGQKQKWSDNHSNEPNKILWLNWFVEAPFLKYFRRQLQFIMELILRRVVNCNSYATVPSSVQLTAFQQSQIFLNGEVSTWTLQ